MAPPDLKWAIGVRRWESGDVSQDGAEIGERRAERRVGFGEIGQVRSEHVKATGNRLGALTMHGTDEMVRDDGTTFMAAIAAFSLASRHALN